MQLVRACETLLHDKAALKSQVWRSIHFMHKRPPIQHYRAQKTRSGRHYLHTSSTCVCVYVCARSLQIRQPYIILVLALLAGDARTLDALTNTLNQLQLPSVLSTIEDYMWCKLVLLQANQVRTSTRLHNEPTALQA